MFFQTQPFELKTELSLLEAVYGIFTVALIFLFYHDNIFIYLLFKSL